MKNLSFALILLVTIVGCKKSETDFPIQNLFGTWELYTTSDGLTGRVTTFPVGNGNTFTFKSDLHYVMIHVYPTGPVSTSGTYQLSSLIDNGGRKINLVSFDNNSIQQDVRLINDTLSLGVYNAYDAGGSSYLKR